MKRNNIFRFAVTLMVTVLCSLMGVGNYVAMAAPGDAEAGTGGANGVGVGAASGAEGRNETGGSGVATKTDGIDFADPDWYTKFIDNEITKVQPTSTPLLQLVSYAKKKSGKSTVVKYYSWGYRPYKTTVSSTLAVQSAQDRIVLPVTDAGIFTVDDTILVLGINGYASDGATQSNDYLELSVCEIDKTSGLPSVYAVNGKASDYGNIWLPEIPQGTKLLRMGKAAGELDAQTGKYYSKPKAQENNVQKFMCQVEQSHVEKWSETEIKNFSWSDVEEEAINDMKRTMEFTFMWGVKGEHVHEGKQGTVWFTQGIWNMAGKEIQVGTNDDAGHDIITDDDMVDVLKDMFVGTNLGGKQKVLLCGSDFLAALSKMKSERLIYRDTVDKWGLKFKSFDSEFGELLAVHAEFMNAAEKSKWAFAFDPDYLRKYTFKSWGRNVIDKNAIGVSETEAAVIREMSCVYLTYAAAHARLFLGSEAAKATPTLGHDGSQKVVRPIKKAAA